MFKNTALKQELNSYNFHLFQIHDLNLKVRDLGGKFKKPALRKVRVSADDMMRALFGSKSKDSMDLRANLKSVKKEDIKQEKVQTLNWTQNPLKKQKTKQ